MTKIWLAKNAISFYINKIDYEERKTYLRLSTEATHTYLARRLTMIMKVVPPGRGPSIALRLG